ncbi:GMC family oxidoreductase [Nocardia sp. NPDC052278]|uniref:GMC family oxidoreductase n=1 Tax=unclassified Nocardia TaxID=2637762 RepID=UPI0036B17168
MRSWRRGGTEASKEWDYIVVGAGSAGCVLSDRLSEVPNNRVLTIEAGPLVTFNARVRLPVGLYRMPKKFDWRYVGQPDPSIGGRADIWSGGRATGGGSTVNGMIWVRGSAADYEAWEKAGATGWGYRDVLPYFRRAETYEGAANAFRGKSGPQYVSKSRVRHALNEAFISAATQAGHRFNDDYNGAEQLGAAQVQLSQRRGLRWSTSDGYLARARRRSNFTLWSRTQALRLTVENGRVTGILVRRKGRTVHVRCAREVVLAAGAIGSPALLLRSGIGPADELSGLGIDVVADRSGVGRNLMEHTCTPVSFDVTIPSLNDELTVGGFIRHGADLVFRGRGAATSTAAQALVFGSFQPGSDRTDFQIMFGPFDMTQAGKTSGSGHDMHKMKLADHSVARALVCAVHPRNRGSVTLRSADPADPPAISYQLYGNPDDCADMVAAVRAAREIARQPAFAKYVEKETSPGAAVESDEEILAAIRARSYGGQHASGTCRMGSDHEAVVDPSLRVNGVAGLRVADASVMPTLTSGNTNAPVIMIAEKAADLILTDETGDITSAVLERAESH